VALSEFDLERRPGVTRALASPAMSPAAELPVIAIVGDRPGPVFVAAAGVHGDEDEGPRALRQVAADLQPTRRRAIGIRHASGASAGHRSP
jgi:predicted deacylase